MIALLRKILPALVSLVIVGATLVGCGTSHPSMLGAAETESSARTSVDTVQQLPATTAPAAGQASTHRGTRRKHHGSRLHATVYNPKPSSSRNASPAAALPASSAQNPCSLVTHTEANAALGGVLREIEAPLGPTCVFERGGHKQSPTLTVEAIHLHRIIAQMKNRPLQLSISGHRAYCGTLGTSLLFVDLGGGRALELNGPCAAGKALAIAALSRINP